MKQARKKISFWNFIWNALKQWGNKNGNESVQKKKKERDFN